jgi:hypothetical protein
MSLSTRPQSKGADGPAFAAVELIYHSYLTGLILMLVSRAGAAKAAEVVFRTFRRQRGDQSGQPSPRNAAIRNR